MGDSIISILANVYFQWTQVWGGGLCHSYTCREEGKGCEEGHTLWKKEAELTKQIIQE